MRSVFRTDRVTGRLSVSLVAVVVLIVVSIVHPRNSHAADLAKPGEKIAAAVELVTRGQVQDGYNSFLELAKAGNPHAMYHLGAITTVAYLAAKIWGKPCRGINKRPMLAY